jgi:hypothetical protein
MGYAPTAKHEGHKDHEDHKVFLVIFVSFVAFAMNPWGVLSLEQRQSWIC